jgi:cytochrome P450
LIQERFEDWVGHGIFNVDGEEWKHQRKVATAEFASSKLRDFSVHVYRSEALKLVQVLSIAAKNHQTVDLQVYCLFLRPTTVSSKAHEVCPN